MINSLQSLRGIFAIFVFLSHYSIFISPDESYRVFYPGGTSAVEYFIVLSGFVMCSGYEKIVEKRDIGYGDFMMRRIVRIYPLHLLCLTYWILTHFLHPEELAGQFGPIVTNLFCVQSWVPDHTYYYGCNTPSWCVGVFFFLYALFPFIIRLYERRPRRFVIGFFIFWAAFTLYIYWLPSQKLGTDLDLYFARIMPPVRVIDFVLGIMLWQLYRYIKEHNLVERFLSRGVVIKTVAELVVVVAYCGGVFLANRLGAKYCTSVIWWIPMILTVMVFALTDGRGGLMSRLLSWRPIIYFGNASFCYYLTHMLTYRSAERVFNHFGLLEAQWPRFWVIFALTLVAALLVYRYIDGPFVTYLRRRLKL